MADRSLTAGSQKLYWAPDNRHLALVDGQRAITIWDTERDTVVPIATARPTTSVVWSPDRSRVAVTDTAHVVTVYDALTGRRLARLGGDDADDLSRVILVPAHRIRDLIGPKGVMVRSIERRGNCRIDIDDDGTVTVTAGDDADLLRAVELIEQVIDPPTVSVGDVFVGTVATVTDYGAFVSLVPGRDGLLHANKFRRAGTADAAGAGGTGDSGVADVIPVAVGDEITVVVEHVLDNGKIGLALVTPDDAPRGPEA